MSNLDTAKPPPHFKKEGDYHRLIVDGKPFLIIGGEIAPSTSSSAASMARKWQDIKTLGLNTVLLAVTWEVFEPKEGEFNTDLVASLVAQAREAGIRVILHVSWYGSMKGGCAQLPTPMISLFGPDFTTAEKTAFAEFVQQVETADSDYDTILMLQIGSEVGYSNCSRDRCDAALTAFEKKVPDEYLDFLVQSGSMLCTANSHAWEEFADDSEDLASLEAPCTYIDLYAPRMFHPKYDEICEIWGSGANQALLVQAHGRCEDDIRLIWSAFGSHGATGVVFSRIEDLRIWNPESHTIQHANLLRQAGPFLLDAQDQDQPHIGIAYNGWDPEELHFTSGEFDITASGRMTRHMYGLAISQGNGKLLLFGHKFELEAESLNDDVVSTHILSCRELKVNEQGRLQVGRTFNAYDTNGANFAMMREDAPMIAELQFYGIKN
ncbi:hypothetical protein COL5a_002314 [Colletotrichum fioriniae]|nr:hypothetical protein COL5a_002314 [Colletotrichum fioriniae]